MSDSTLWRLRINTQCRIYWTLHQIHSFQNWPIYTQHGPSTSKQTVKSVIENLFSICFVWYFSLRKYKYYLYLWNHIYIFSLGNENFKFYLYLWRWHILNFVQWFVHFQKIWNEYVFVSFMYIFRIYHSFKNDTITWQCKINDIRIRDVGIGQCGLL